MYSLYSIKTSETRLIRFPAKTFTNVVMVQGVIKDRVSAQTHHTGKNVQIQGVGPLPVWQSTIPEIAHTLVTQVTTACNVPPLHVFVLQV